MVIFEFHAAINKYIAIADQFLGASHIFCLTKLRRHTPYLPGTEFIALVDEAVVQPVVAGLPELQSERGYPVATPERRQWYFTVRVALFHLLHHGLEYRAGIDELALWRRPSADLAAAGAGNEILQGFSAADLGGGTGYFNLAAERVPGKQQTDFVVAGDMFRLATAIIGEKDKTLIVEQFQQHHALPRLGVGIHRGQAHCGGFG